MDFFVYHRRSSGSDNFEIEVTSSPVPARELDERGGQVQRVFRGVVWAEDAEEAKRLVERAARRG